MGPAIPAQMSEIGMEKPSDDSSPTHSITVTSGGTPAENHPAEPS